jgi:hypothetical protein
LKILVYFRTPINIIGALQAIALAFIGRMFARDSKKRLQAIERAEVRATLRAEESRQTMQLMSASVHLGVMTATAIMEGKNNGGMNEALKNAKDTQQSYYNFIREAAAKQLSSEND